MFTFLTLPFSSLYCSLSVTFKPTYTLFTSFSSSPCSCSYYLPDALAPGPYRCLLSYCLTGSLSCSSRRRALFTSFLSSSPSSIHVCRSYDYVEHVQRTSTAQPSVSLATHVHYVPSSQMDTRSDELPLNKQN